MSEDIKDFELGKVRQRLRSEGLQEGRDFHVITLPDFRQEAWRLVGMVEHPAEDVYVNGHGFYESLAHHFRTALEEAYKQGCLSENS